MLRVGLQNPQLGRLGVTLEHVPRQHNVRRPNASNQEGTRQAHLPIFG